MNSQLTDQLIRELSLVMGVSMLILRSIAFLVAAMEPFHSL